MALPKLITSKGMDVKKGWFDMSSLDYSAKMDATVTAVVPAGSVVHLTAAGDFTPGASNTQPAIFLIQGNDDPDVANPGGAGLDRSQFLHVPVAPTGKMSGLVATGGYEIASTAFDASETYAPGDLLTAGNDGQLTNQGAVQFVNPIVGVVSSGLRGMAIANANATDEVLNHNGMAALSFWSVWLPGAAS